MNGNTEFVDAISLENAPSAIYNTVGNLWRVEPQGGGTPVFLEAPDIAGQKTYSITVDDVSLIYDPDRKMLIWSISWSR